MAALDLDRELAELDPLPAHDLATRARALTRDADTDVDQDEPAQGRREERVARPAGRRPRSPSTPGSGSAPSPLSAASMAARTLGAIESLNGAFARHPLHRIRSSPHWHPIAGPPVPPRGEASTRPLPPDRGSDACPTTAVGYRKAMHIRRGYLGWGVFLILTGAVPLAVRAGYLTTTRSVGCGRSGRSSSSGSASA